MPSGDVSAAPEPGVADVAVAGESIASGAAAASGVGTSHVPSVDAETTVSGTGGIPGWVSSSGPFPPDRAFDWGTIDGSRQIDKEHFEGYLEHSVIEELARTRIAEADAEVTRWAAREADALSASAEHVRAEEALRLAEADAARLRAEHDAEQVALADAARHARAKADDEDAAVRGLPSGRGVVMYGALFVGAAMSFIVGDFVIALSTVADALAMTDSKAMLFALGLGLMPVVLKPAYDRLVEEPYHEKQRRPFVWTILLMCAVTLGALGVLGALRSASFVASRQAATATEAIERARADLEELSGNPALATELAQERPRLEREIAVNDSLLVASTEGLIESPLGFWSYILSGLLFAVAGALCLGIGMKHIRDHQVYRTEPAARAATLRAQADADDARAERSRRAPIYASAEGRLADLRAAVEAARVRAASVSALDECREKLEAAREERRKRLAEASEGRQEKLIHLYRDGYELGLKRPEDYPSGKDESGASASTSSRPRRPFIELRRAVSRRTIGESAALDPTLN